MAEDGTAAQAPGAGTAPGYSQATSAAAEGGRAVQARGRQQPVSRDCRNSSLADRPSPPGPGRFWTPGGLAVGNTMLSIVTF